MTNEKKFTWYDLKKFCDSLSGKQLGYEVKAWGETKAFTLKGVEQLEDDMFDPSGEGMEPVSYYKQDSEQWEQVKDEPTLAYKGEPRLIID